MRALNEHQVRLALPRGPCPWPLPVAPARGPAAGGRGAGRRADRVDPAVDAAPMVAAAPASPNGGQTTAVAVRTAPAVVAAPVARPERPGQESSSIDGTFCSDIRRTIGRLSGIH